MASMAGGPLSRGQGSSRPAHPNKPGSRPERGHDAPPEQTGAETNYLVKNMEARTPMVVRLVGNEEVRGWIEYYDRQMIKINRREPPHLFIRKEQIKYMFKDEGATSPKREDD